MFEQEVRQEDIANDLGVSKTYVSRRMTGKDQWELDVVYKVCDILSIPYTEISVYWPK
jgi:transcriptional regulator with XRE-family HTH domain